MTSWKRRIRSLVRRSGYDIVRMDPGKGPPGRVMDCDLWPWLKTVGCFRTLVDIGANTGEYGAFIARYLGVQRAHMFEPQADCAAAIRRNLARVKDLRIYSLALSDRAEDLDFRQMSYGPSSSILPLSARSLKEFPEIRELSHSRIEAARLDDVLDHAAAEPEIFVKMDVQGFEDRVIDGGSRLFSSARAVMVEMSFVPVYDGQPLFEEVHERLTKHGLRLAGLQNQIMSVRTGQPLFAHCVYVRPDPPQDLR